MVVAAFRAGLEHEETLHSPSHRPKRPKCYEEQVRDALVKSFQAHKRKQLVWLLHCLEQCRPLRLGPRERLAQYRVRLQRGTVGSSLMPASDASKHSAMPRREPGACSHD
ncbi:hypothetical protein [Mumia zhuanghuii]|uniref:Uncharacterized protein n=1 Tax=Mumia zhuanghuii TaxID=2585211 RepID=A0A5C4LVJ1_9ACTN|nr:hypothetical protein [Mumia zhuanghuii]TNC21766.1 hypothetical protein FHE65_36285 [Mumia zhuanghuii]